MNKHATLIARLLWPAIQQGRASVLKAIWWRFNQGRARFAILFYLLGCACPSTQFDGGIPLRI